MLLPCMLVLCMNRFKRKILWRPEDFELWFQEFNEETKILTSTTAVFLQLELK